jgi:16S rRNA (uracil1498-N3)-methyltransferase
MRFFYAPTVGTPFHTLDAEESRHVFKVLRLREGDEVLLTDGAGGRFRGQLVGNSRTASTLATTRLEDAPPPPRRLTLAVAPPRAAERWEWLLEKATEIGVTDIQPMLTARTEPFKERRDRWERILAGAMKQSQQCWLPRLHAPLGWEGFLAGATGSGGAGGAGSGDAGSGSGLGAGFLAHCLPVEGPKPHLIQVAPAAGDVWVAIGPEGDFTPAEVAAGRAAGVREVDLGPHRLRTETAAWAAVHAVHLAGLRPG